MDVCDTRHTPQFQVKYIAAKGSNYNPIWLVCGMCMETKRCFSDKGQIESIEALA